MVDKEPPIWVVLSFLGKQPTIMYNRRRNTMGDFIGESNKNISEAGMG